MAQYGLAPSTSSRRPSGCWRPSPSGATSRSRSRYESSFLEHVWHWDDFYDATIGRPLTRAAQFSDDVIEPKVIDGAVTGVAVGVRRSAEGLRKVQSGFVRHYALATVLGVAVVIVFLVARVG